LPKISREIAEIWRRVLEGVPDSRLAIKSRGLEDLTTCEDARSHLVSYGLPESRIARGAAQFFARLDAANKQAKQAKRAGGAKQAKGKKTKLDLDDIIKNGEGGHFSGNRSAAVWWVIHELLRRNTTDSDILAILLDRNNKISDHVYDQGNPQDYAERQIAQAHAVRVDWHTRDRRHRPDRRQRHQRIAGFTRGHQLPVWASMKCRHAGCGRRFW
jgi:hypothetical protein